MPPIPPSVAANQVILASWGNAVRAALNATLGRITQAGQLLVGSGTTDATALDPPSALSVLRASSSGAISWLAAGALDAATWIETRSITRDQIADNTIQATQIFTRTITRTQIADDTIQAGQIEDDTITRDQIADDTIQAGQIEDDTITRDQIAASTIRGAQIDGRTITGAKLATNTVTDAELANAVTDAIDDATDYRTNMVVQTEPIDPTLYAVGTQGIYVPARGVEQPVHSPDIAGETLSLGGGSAAGLAVYGSTIAVAILDNPTRIRTYNINTRVNIDNFELTSFINARGLTYDGTNLRVHRSSPTRVVIVNPDTGVLGDSVTLSGLGAQFYGLTHNDDGFIILSGPSQSPPNAFRYDNNFTFVAEYPLSSLTAGNHGGGVASTSDHFYIVTPTEPRAAAVFRSSDGSRSPNREFNLGGSPPTAFNFRGAAIFDNDLWLITHTGALWRYPLRVTHDYRALINGVVTQVQPEYGDMYTLTSYTGGNKWLRQTQLPV